MQLPAPLKTPYPSATLIYDFISPGEEAFLLEKVDGLGALSALQDEGVAKKVGGWVDLNGRRAMYWGGALTPSNTLIPRAPPAFMNAAWPNVFSKIAETGAFDSFKGKGREIGPNHCLVNEYMPGEGILPHTDGPAYEPIVSNLSLGSHTILTLRPSPSFYDGVEQPSSSDPGAPLAILPAPSSEPTSDAPPPPPEVSILLPPRSLFLLTSTLYSTFLHTIEARSLDTMEQLRACVNWDEYWASVLESEVAGAEGKDGELVENEVEAVDEARRQHGASRRMVEAGKGWERGRRISLTCRRVSKVRTGIKLG